MNLPERCPVCDAATLQVVDSRAARCRQCGLLLNRQTAALDYADGGGQAPPDAGKMRWRRANARRRLAIIAPHLAGHRALIDIGCGSGEMLLEAAGFPLRLGFDTNLTLIRHIREQHGLTVIASAFDAARLPAEFAAAGKVFALSHVLEHLDRPLELLAQIRAAMAPGDLLYVEVPLHTGRSFREQGYRWNLWNHEHVALWSPQALTVAAQRQDFAILDQGTRIFARGSYSTSTRLRLLRQAPLAWLATALGKPRHLSIADRMIGDYGYLVLRRPG